MNDIENQTWQAVANANLILEEINATSVTSKLWYPVFDTYPASSGFASEFKILVISDSAFKNLKSKHSQSGYVIPLVRSDRTGSVGGLCHVLEFNSRRSRRVVKSTWGAEMHAFIAALERAERIYYWLKEIWQGPTGIPGIDRVSTMTNTDNCITLQASID